MAKKLARFDSSKHPRGRGGRFTTTTNTDRSKSNTQRKNNIKRRISLNSLSDKQQSQLLKSFTTKVKPASVTLGDKASRTVHNGRVYGSDVEARKLLLSKMSRSQISRLHQTFNTADRVILPSGKPRPITRAELAAHPDRSTATRRLASSSVRGARGTRSHIKVTDTGIDLKVAPHDPSFRKEPDPDFSYDVLVQPGRVRGAESHHGQTVTLNNHETRMFYNGDVFRGVPPLHADVTNVKDQDLVDSLYTSIQETTKGRAPRWEPEKHGSVPNAVVKRNPLDGSPDYMGMQIHHNDQWARDPAREIEADYAAGRITLEERYSRYLDNVRPSVDNSNGWEIAVRPRGEREFVILAGGLHQAGTPLYESVHPPMINPETGEFEHISIPKGYGGTGKPTATGREDGESRTWFDARVRSQFWKEYYKDQANILGAELKRRVEAGDITLEKAASLLTQAKTNYDTAEEARSRTASSVDEEVV